MYRTICCELWTDEKVQALTPHEKLLFLYLITNPHSHMSGIYYLPTVFIQHELNLGRGFDGVWMGLLKSGLVEADMKRSQLWVVNMLPYQARGHKAEKGVASHLNTLHASPLVERFLITYPQIIPYLPPSFTRYPIDTLSIPHGSTPYPDSDSDSVPDSFLSSLQSEEGKEPEKGEGETDFDLFWKSYPKRVGGKKNALKAWERAKDRPPLAEILAVLERAKQTDQWKKDGGQYIPYPSTWLNKGMWADDVTVLDSAFKRSMNSFLERHKEE